MTAELYKRYRPQEFEEVIGQAAAVKTLKGFIDRRKVPHTMLFSGPSGTGKTTLARILRRKLGCGDMDYDEKNCAKDRGIDMVRDIAMRMGSAALSGRCRVFLLDECHQLTGEAQSGLLKMLEDTPRHVYFILCTTHAQKLLKTIKTRCTDVPVKEVPAKDLIGLVNRVAENEKIELGEDVAAKIAEHSLGSARMALVLLEAMIGLDPAEQLAKAAQGGTETEAIKIAKQLMNPRTTWKDMSATLKEVLEADGDAEGLRRMVMGYVSAALMGGGWGSPLPRCFVILDEFKGNFFDNGKAGLIAACYAVIELGKK